MRFYLAVILLSVQITQPIIGQNKVEVTKLGPGVNSAAEEIMPLWDSERNLLYFSRVFHPENKGGRYSGADIWVKDLNDNTETAKKDAIDELNNKSNNFVVGVAASGDTLYLNQPFSSDLGFTYSALKEDTWKKPKNIKIQGLPLEGYRSLYVSPDQKVAFLSLADAFGKEDLFYSLKNEDGIWEKPVNLGTSINTEGSEISPFLSEDKRRLYFASDGHGGAGGMDIFMAERLYDSWLVWSKPVNLGNKINSSSFDAYYSIYGDSLAFFSSNRAGELANLYKVKLSKADNYTEDQPIDLVVKSSDYLSEQEKTKIFGFNFIPLINFEDNSDVITSKSKEVLFFLADQMKANTNIKADFLSPSVTKDFLLENRIKRLKIFFENADVPPERIEFRTRELNENAERIDTYFEVFFLNR